MSLPGKMSYETTPFGFRMREVLIVGTALFVGVVLLLTPIGGIFIRIVLASAILAGSILYAFVRINRIFTIEEALFKKFRFTSRDKKYIRGGALVDNTSHFNMAQDAQAHGGRMVIALPQSWAFQDNWDLTGKVVGMFLLTVFLSFLLFGGGYDALMREIKSLVYSLSR